MKYFRFKNSKSQKRRKNGTVELIPLLVEKDRKFAKTAFETAISRKRPLIITGASHSGRTSNLQKFFEHALDIWGGQPRVTAKLWLGGMDPISAWQEQENVMDWHDQTQTKGESSLPLWKALKAHQRDQQLVKFCQKHRTAVFIDDAHKLSGRKANLAKQCVMVAKVVVLATTEENRLPPALRVEVLRQNPQIFNLNSEAAFDLTPVVIWGTAGACFLLGAWEVGVALISFRWLSRGRRAAREE